MAAVTRAPWMDRIVTQQPPSAAPTDSAAIGATSASWRAYVQLLRPTQWIKNVVVFAGPAAGLTLSSATSVAQAFCAFVGFCLIASATYAINDVLDRAADVSHPTKRNRPVARGAIRPASALVVAAFLILFATGGTAIFLPASVTIVLLLYFSVTLAYSAALKRQAIMDVIIVALGFVLRALAGSLAVGVATSDWLVACVFTLCLFMGFGKRRCELAMIGNRDEAGQHRSTLLRYTPDLLNHLITVSAGIAVITFLLYTLEISGHETPFHKQHLFYTLPLVVYGIFRFAMLTELGVFSGPTEIVLKDRALLVTVLLWTVIALAIAYEGALFGPQGFEGILGAA